MINANVPVLGKLIKVALDRIVANAVHCQELGGRKFHALVHTVNVGLASLWSGLGRGREARIANLERME